MRNPVVKRELKIRICTAKAVLAVTLRCACLGFLFFLILLSRLASGFAALILAEALLILLFTPGAVCDAFASHAGRRDLCDLALTRLNSGVILLGKLVGANLYTSIIVALSAFAMCAASLFYRDLHIWRIVCANVVLLILLLASALIGLAFSVLFRRNILAPAMLMYILVFLIIGSVVIPGPLIERMENFKIKAAIVKVALYVNPLIMTSRALGRMDIMRTEYMYNLADPIVGPGFTYPNWYSAASMYLGISCLLLIPISIGFRFARRLPASP